jgi:hypothetical protein
MKHSVVLLSGIMGILLVGCQKEELPSLPQGVQEISGVLARAELSLVRRGTHILIQGGIPRYYVESPTVSVQEYEGRVVQIRGTLTRNNPPTELPVLIVGEILERREEMFRTWSIPALGLSLEVPRMWNGSIEGVEATFTASGASRLTLTLTLEAIENLPVDSLPIVVDTKRAIRSVNVQTGEQKVIVDLLKGQALTIRFTPSAQPPVAAEEDRELFLAILHSITFTHSSKKFSESSVSSKPSASPMGGKPCGGPAGILCPQRQYCAITDVTTNIGKCKQLPTAN